MPGFSAGPRGAGRREGCQLAQGPTSGLMAGGLGLRLVAAGGRFCPVCALAIVRLHFCLRTLSKQGRFHLPNPVRNQPLRLPLPPGSGSLPCNRPPRPFRLRGSIAGRNPEAMGCGHPPTPPPDHSQLLGRGLQGPVLCHLSRVTWAGRAAAPSFSRSLSLPFPPSLKTSPLLASAPPRFPGCRSALNGTPRCQLEKALPAPLPTLSPIRARSQTVTFFQRWSSHF